VTLFGDAESYNGVYSSDRQPASMSLVTRGTSIMSATGVDAKYSVQLVGLDA
jgi:hypothetical protein